MSSMRVPQKHRTIQACIAKLPPQQRICHPEEPLRLTRKTQNVDPPHAPEQRSEESISQDGVGALFILDLLQFCHTEKHPPRGNTGIFLFYSSWGWGGHLTRHNSYSWTWKKNVLSFWKHKDLLTSGMPKKKKKTMDVNGRSRKTEGPTAPIEGAEERLHCICCIINSRKAHNHGLPVFMSHLFLFIQVCLNTNARFLTGFFP